MQEIETKLGKAIIRVKTDDFDEMEKVCVWFFFSIEPSLIPHREMFSDLKARIEILSFDCTTYVTLLSQYTIPSTIDHKKCPV